MKVTPKHLMIISAVSAISSLFLAAVLFLFKYEIFSTNLTLTYTTFGMVLIICSNSIVPYLIIGRNLLTLLITFTIQGLSLIIIFAAIYRGHGLEAITEYDIITYTPIIPENDFATYILTPSENNIIAYKPAAPETAIYFSIVTWTTLGYGDFQPPEDLRLIAAIEALIGYLYLGLFVTLMGAMLLRKSPAKE